MNKSELAIRLRTSYTPTTNCGVTHVHDHNYKHILFVVPPPPPKLLPIKQLPLKSISRALRILSEQKDFKTLSELDKTVLYLFNKREAVHSSRMEGTWSTIDQALTPSEMIKRSDFTSTHQSVRDYAAILEVNLQKAFHLKEEVFDLKLILNLHKMIIERDPTSRGVPGKLRAPGQTGSIVTIGGGSRIENSIYNPAPPNHVRRCFKDFLSWISSKELAQLGDAGMGLSLPVRLAIGHSHFEAIHPFTDGNGRTGRALWPLQMAASHHTPLFLSGFVEANREDYLKSLQLAQKKLLYGPLIELLSEGLIASAQEAQITKTAILKLPTIWLRRGNFRQNSAAQRALLYLTQTPIITSDMLQDKLELSGPAIHRALDQLVQANILRPRGKKGRTVIYAAEELIQILSRPFGTLPIS